MLFEKISRRCKALGISISGLEKECGLGNATIRGWKNSSPRAEHLKRVADRLGVSVDELLKVEDTAQPSAKGGERG